MYMGNNVWLCINTKFSCLYIIANKLTINLIIFQSATYNYWINLIIFQSAALLHIYTRVRMLEWVHGCTYILSMHVRMGAWLHIYIWVCMLEWVRGCTYIPSVHFRMGARVWTQNFMCLPIVVIYSFLTLRFQTWGSKWLSVFNASVRNTGT